MVIDVRQGRKLIQINSERMIQEEVRNLEGDEDYRSGLRGGPRA